MKRKIYDLGNEEFAFFVNRLGEVLRQREILYTLVGGVAVQAHVLSRLTQRYQTDIASLAANKDLRFQDHVRATDDIDLALKFPVDRGEVSADSLGQIVGFCDDLEGVYLSPDHSHIFEYNQVRDGISRPVFSVKVDEDQHENLFLNISRQSRHLKRISYTFYPEFIDAGQELEIPYNQHFNLKVRVYRPEHVLATKVSHFRAKDAMDIKNLVDVMTANGEEIDTAEMERILLPVHITNYGRFGVLTGIPVNISLSN